MRATNRVYSGLVIIPFAVLAFGLWWLFAPHSPAANFLRDAVVSGDRAEISRAFLDAVYSRKWRMSEVIPALRSHLNDTNLFVRYHAAKALFTVGDRRGKTTLVALMQSPGSIGGMGQDPRVEAARTLAKFREKDAASAIYELYGRTSEGSLLEPLTTLGSSQVAPIIQAKGFVSESSAMKYYALNGVEKFIPQIRAVFQNTTKQELKAAAAWALATMSGDQNAVDYLVQASQPAIRPLPGAPETLVKARSEAWHAQDALRYLGSIHTPPAKQTLEAALDSQIPSVLEIATVNLLFNQGGSEKAIQVVAQQLREITPSSKWMAWDLTLSIAAQMIDNPEIQAAGQAFAQKSQDGSWRYYTVERRNWPIYNWIDNYVVKLNE